MAHQIRGWIPQTLQPPPPPPPPRSLPVTAWRRIETWVSHNRALTAAVVAFVGTGATFLILQKLSYGRRRKARRAANNARTEIVVLVGSSPLTTSLALDLERRGFIVYMITGSTEDEQHVRNFSRVDILPLTLDLSYPEAAHDQIQRLRRLLARHQFAIEGGEAHRLSLAGVIIAPDTVSEIGPVSDLAPESWSTAYNGKVLNPVLTTQHLLPLVTDFKSKILLLTPSIVPSLRPPHHAIQSSVSGALEGFAGSLAAELRLHDVGFCHFKLGHLDIPGRHRDAKNVRGTHVRKLHDSVFDALRSRRSSTWHVGRGSLVYDIIGGWLPSGVVGWMMGLHKVEREGTSSLENSQSSAQWEKIEQSS